MLPGIRVSGSNYDFGEIMKNIKNVLMLLLTAFIWGIAFVAQTTGGDAVGAYSFNCIRSFIAVIVLFPVIRFLDSKGLSGDKPTCSEDRKRLWKAGLLCGICLGSASLLQQVGITMGTAAGKAGFLTACYIILVPVISVFVGKKSSWNIWLAVLITVAGLYLLCINGSFSIQKPDSLILLCSVLFALQIMVVDYFVVSVDPVRLSQIQFLTAGVISLIMMAIFEIPKIGLYVWISSFGSWEAWSSILFAGVMSSGVAYTLQIVGQKGFNPTIASLLMSLESVFSVLAGWALLHQKLSYRELLGCLLVFVAVVLAQIPINEIMEKRKTKC